MSTTPRIQAQSPSARAAAALVGTLDDDGALRENPLVRAFVEAAREKGADVHDVADFVRRNVRRTLAESADGANALLSARAARIVVRCDGAGESHRTVMNDLAISRAEFYRQLAAGRQGLALALGRMALPSPPPDARTIDTRLQGALALAQTGRLDEAVAYLAPMLARCRGVEFIRVACTLAEFHLDANRRLEAQAASRLARAAADALQGYDADVAQTKVDSLDMSIAIKAGGAETGPSLRALEARRARLRAIGRPDDSFAMDTLAELVHVFATREAYAGRFDAAFALLVSSPANDPTVPVAPTTRAELFMRLGSIRMLLPEPLDAALDDCRASIRYASSHGLQRVVTAGLADRAAIASIRGDTATATDAATDAVASSRAFLAPWDHAGVCTMAASVALDAGRAEDARDFALEARKCVDRDAFPAVLSYVYEADALQARGRADESLRLIREVEAVLAARPSALVAGRAAYVRGRAHRARGAKAHALNAARESIELLEGAGHRHALLRALAFTIEVAPDAKVRRRFVELRSTL